MSIALVATTLMASTSAYFNDTETSANNYFEAGQIDLTIDNEAWYNGAAQDGNPAGELDATWALTDLTSELFFYFDDVKPGDYGTDKMSYHVADNPAWGCFNVTTTLDDENTANEPELDEVGEVADDPANDFDGELDSDLEYFFYLDINADGVYDAGDTIFTGTTPGTDDFSGFVAAPGSNFTLADFDTNNIGGVAGDPVTPLNPYHIGFAWCYGDITPNTAGGSSMYGYDCDGSMVTNISQSDIVELTLAFYAIQQRNNLTWDCSTWTP